MKFCVTNTLRLPPVSLNHIDVAALMKNLMETRTELLKCQAMQARYDENLSDSMKAQQANKVTTGNKVVVRLQLDSK